MPVTMHQEYLIESARAIACATTRDEQREVYVASGGSDPRVLQDSSLLDAALLGRSQAILSSLALELERAVGAAVDV